MLLSSQNKTLAALALCLALTVSAGAQTSQTRRQAAIESGDVLLGGVSLAETTPIADLLDEMEQFDGTVVQIEGTVVALCSGMGCWAQLDDGSGNRLNVKVEDGIIDLREVASEEHYMVAEGVFQKTGEHGAQVFIMEHGAVIEGIE
ncbi:MAG: DUF4920 domain-containing protein [Acidobacteria bacterium]|nr:DUF4920 domain-containing protein [Acidobacteriota bacterium]